MAEYIEREKVVEELNNIATDYIKDNSIQCSIAAGVVINIRDTVILEQPTADVVEIKYGKWRLETDEEMPDFMFKLVVCSVCGSKSNQMYRYCPCCGAKMDGERRCSDEKL